MYVLKAGKPQHRVKSLKLKKNARAYTNIKFGTICLDCGGHKVRSRKATSLDALGLRHLTCADCGGDGIALEEVKHMFDSSEEAKAYQALTDDDREVSMVWTCLVFPVG